MINLKKKAEELALLNLKDKELEYIAKVKCIEQALLEVRNEALEEAEILCSGLDYSVAREKIRSLKEKSGK